MSGVLDELLRKAAEKPDDAKPGASGEEVLDALRRSLRVLQDHDDLMGTSHASRTAHIVTELTRHRGELLEERDGARDVAVQLEQQIAAVLDACDKYAIDVHTEDAAGGAPDRAVLIEDIRRALGDES